MKVLILGSYGYIGSSLYNALKDKHRVFAATRHTVDLLDSKACKKFFDKNKFDAVIHCAAVGGSRLKTDNEDVLDDNIRMYYNILENRGSYKKLIYFGSGAEVFMSNEPYGFSKAVIKKSMENKDGFHNIRIYAVFDENELATRFIKSSIKKYINKEPIKIYKDKIMDFFYMKDLISVVESYISNDNVLSKNYVCAYRKDQKQSLLSIANIINNLSDYKVEIVVEDKSSVSNYSEYRNDTMQDDFEKDFIGLEEGIKMVYEKLKTGL